MAIKGFVGLVLIALFGYGTLQARHLLAGPSITITIPSNYTTFSDGFVTIEGMAENTENLSLNGGLLPIDEKGHFQKTVVYAKGGGILSLTATDRFGRTVTEQRTIFITSN